MPPRSGWAGRSRSAAAVCARVCCSTWRRSRERSFTFPSRVLASQCDHGRLPVSSETTATGTTPARPDLTDPGMYFNRELSWLEFNARVLELAEDPTVPLLERVKFLAIVSSNLDEFFMVRVAGLHDMIDAGIDKPREDGRSPRETLDAIREVVREHSRRQSDCLQREVRPALAEHGIR